MSGTASKAVGLSDGYRWHSGTVLRPDHTLCWGVGLRLGTARDRVAPAPYPPLRLPRRVPSRGRWCWWGVEGHGDAVLFQGVSLTPPKTYSTPGTLKAVQVALVKPVAYLKYW